MSLTRSQQAVCRLLAANRVEQGEAYVAGGVALNLPTGGKRISRDIDLFHDTRAALEATWQADLYTGNLKQLKQDLLADTLVFHAGSIRGACPQMSR